jgi:hypothetical protein
MDDAEPVIAFELDGAAHGDPLQIRTRHQIVDGTAAYGLLLTASAEGRDDPCGSTWTVFGERDCPAV